MRRLHKPVGIIIHHSETRDSASVSYNAIKDYHINKKHWDDIGYHFVIEQVGDDVEIFTGRGIQYQGAHAIGHNTMIGICVVGNYDKTTVPPQLLDTLFDVIRGLLVMYPNIGVEDIHYHREFSSKTCPGDRFPPLSRLVARLLINPLR